MKHIQSDFDFTLGLRNSPIIQRVAAIFNILATKGNHKEVFLKTAETLYQLKFSDVIDETDLNPYFEDEQVVSLRGAPSKESASGSIPTKQHSTREQYFDLKFSLLYELLSASLRGFNVAYPSRILATATSVLLSVTAANMAQFTLLSIGIVMRRLYIFARDYEYNGDTPVSGSEIVLQQKLLQTFVTWSVRICLDRFAIQWSQRLNYEIKSGVENGSPDERRGVCRIALHTYRLTQVMERFGQMAFAFDLDPIEEMRKMANSDRLLNQNIGEEDDMQLSNSTFSNLSDDGIVLLATQIMFENRNPKDEIPFPEIVKISLKLLDRPEDVAPLGILDAVEFWGVWSSRNVSNEVVQSIDKEEFFRYLQQLMIMSATMSDKQGRYITYSLAVRLLSLHKPEVTFEFLVDTLKYCPFETIKDAAVRMLKAFCLKSDSVEQLTNKLESTNISGTSSSPKLFIDLDSKRSSVVQDLIEKCVRDIEESDGLLSEHMPVLLSWINFASVIPTSKKFVETLNQRCRDFSKVAETEDKDLTAELQRRKAILDIALESLVNATATNKD